MSAWSYQPSINNFVSLTSGQVATWSQLNIFDNTNMSITFTINIQNTNSNWRSIFHVTNKNNNCCNIGDRVPAFWITSGATTLHICNSTSSTGNAYFYSPSISLNTDTDVKIVWSGKVVNVYFNNGLVSTYTHSNTLTAPISDANVYICDPWYSTGGFKIKNFNIYNGNIISTSPIPGLNYYRYTNNKKFCSYPGDMAIFNNNANGSGVVTTIQNNNNTSNLYSTYGFSGSTYIALKFEGNFVPTSTGTWGFVMGDTTANKAMDDIAYLWVGNNALSPTTSNYSMVQKYSDGANTFNIQMTANKSYRLLMYWGQGAGAFVISLGIIPPGGNVTYDGTPYYNTGPPGPSLKNSNFSQEYFSNMNEEKISLNTSIIYNSFKIIRVFVLIIIIIILIYISIKKEK